MKKKILIIDDDRKLQALLGEYLGNAGYDVVHHYRGEGFDRMISDQQPDIVILDIMLPGADGLDILRELRKGSDLPVIMLTARGDDTDRVVGLELGADDYCGKPFNPRELLARIRAVLRRGGHRRQDEPLSGKTRITAGTIVLDTGELSLGGKLGTTVLSFTECKILEALMRRPGITVSRDDIMNYARGRDFMAFERSIDVHISKLRAKLREVAGERETIRTVRGAGYRFLPQDG